MLRGAWRRACDGRSHGARASAFSRALARLRAPRSASARTAARASAASSHGSAASPRSSVRSCPLPHSSTTSPRRPADARTRSPRAGRARARSARPRGAPAASAPSRHAREDRAEVLAAVVLLGEHGQVGAAHGGLARAGALARDRARRRRRSPRCGAPGRGVTAARALASAGAVWAKSTITVAGRRATTCILPGTPRKRARRAASSSQSSRWRAAPRRAPRARCRG
jgi:hypothetical protein